MRLAIFSFPTTIIITPSIVVQIGSITRVVGMILSLSISDAIESAIAARNTSPASCTWPIANGNDEKHEKHN
jgi:hypothetical protein